MNIDTSTLTANNDKSNYLSSMQSSKSIGDKAFKSQLQTLSANSSGDSDKIETKTDVKTEDKTSEKKIENSSNDDDKKVDAKKDEKIEKAENKQENIVKNDDKEQKEQNSQQNQQNQQNAQNGQNFQPGTLTEEVAALLKLNTGLDGINSVQNTKFSAGISEDVYTSAPAINYANFSMSDDDAMFFANLVTKTDMSMQSIAGEFQKSLDAGNVQTVQKTAKVSSVLMDALSDSMKTNKAFRIDFDKDISVIMRVDRNGNLNANFIPGDRAVEAYLKNNISYLKQRFDEQNLPYNDLTYSKHKQGQNEEKRNNKENNHE